MSIIHISTEVAQALKNKQPIVALESTIISHGMPWPENLETALQVENEVRQIGVVPATIAILDGKICVGLCPDQLASFARHPAVLKVSLRDLPYVVSQELSGGTTVAATMRIAAMAGIHVFATGGIGGVHRGATTSMDISADLPEMEKTSVAIVSAGVKSILDIGLTLEYLETAGVPVITIGQDAFPSFYSNASHYQSPMRLDDPASVAKLLHTKWSLGLNGSVLIANPLDHAHAVPADKMETIITETLAEAQKQGITGKEVTPFLLRKIADKTAGESLEANIALIRANARMAAEIALEYAKIRHTDVGSL
jgi:pseudouridine-5'-phosphate glycosidase